MTNRFLGQAAIVTGGAEGIGKGIAKRIAAEGATVILFHINGARLERTVAELSGLGYAVTGHVVDIADEDAVAIATQTVLETVGRLDIMINSAGVVGPTSTPITDYNLADFDAVYRINLRGAWL